MCCRPLRFRFQFSLRALLTAVVVAAAFLAWPLSRVRRQAEIVRHIGQCGGEVFYSSEVNSYCFGPPPPLSPAARTRLSLSRILGQDLFYDVVSVQLEGPQVKQDLLRELRELPTISYVVLVDTSALTVSRTHFRIAKSRSSATVLANFGDDAPRSLSAVAAASPQTCL
jgi:hypothetical protein